MFNKIKSYFSGVITETRKVVWPSRRQVIDQTTVVIVTVLIAIIIFGLVDYGLSTLLKYFIVGGNL